jgi:hypothetical protein
MVFIDPLQWAQSADHDWRFGGLAKMPPSACAGLLPARRAYSKSEYAISQLLTFDGARVNGQQELRLKPLHPHPVLPQTETSKRVLGTTRNIDIRWRWRPSETNLTERPWESTTQFLNFGNLIKCFVRQSAPQNHQSVQKVDIVLNPLVDADFAVTVTTQKMEVQSRLAAVLGGTVKPSWYLTRSSTHSLTYADPISYRIGPR